MRETGIFTGTTDSLSPLRRQCPNRYAIRAGRNLPDKEFRYLRTVIVTAAVYWDFDQELAPHHLIFQHRAGVTPYTSTFVFAECCVFDKQSQPPIYCNPFMLRCSHHTTGAHLLPKLRCQIAEFLRKGSLKRLGILSPSTCVGLRYGLRFGSPSRFFLAAWSQWLCGPKASRSRLGVDGGADLPTPPAYTLQPALPIAGPPILLRHPWINSSRRYRNIDLFPIDYAFRPRLRDRLTLSGLTFLRKP